MRLPDNPTDITDKELYERYSKGFRKAVDSVFAEDTDSELSDRLRANVSRFAAYKAMYVETAVKNCLNDPAIPEKERSDMAKRILRVFDRYQDAEYNTAVARSRTAKQFEEYMQPDNVRLFPNLKWLPSRSAAPRALHQTFYNRVWAKGDPFWAQNAPGTEWNCKCDLEETDEPVTDNSAVKAPTVPLGLEGNPAKTGEVFTDKASYIRNAGNNRKQRDSAEWKCESIAHKSIKSNSKQHPLLQQSYPCEIDGEMRDVHFDDWGISETAYSMLGKKNLYWLKNEILNNPEKYFKNAEYISSADVDLSHNTNRNRLRLKRNFKKYHYLKIQLANETLAYLNIVEHNNGSFYLYTISKNITEY